jgi:hypothetical protein
MVIDSHFFESFYMVMVMASLPSSTTIAIELNLQNSSSVVDFIEIQ